MTVARLFFKTCLIGRGASRRWRGAHDHRALATFALRVDLPQALPALAAMRLWWALLPLAPAVLGQSANDSESLLWGAYRPNLYFGLRPRIPQSLMTGLLWFGTQDYQSLTRKLLYPCV